MADSGTAADDRLPDRGDAIGALGELRDILAAARLAGGAR